MALRKPGLIALFDVDGTLTAPRKCFTGISCRLELQDSTGGCVKNRSLQCGSKDVFFSMSTSKLAENPQSRVKVIAVKIAN